MLPIPTALHPDPVMALYLQRQELQSRQESKSSREDGAAQWCLSLQGSTWCTQAEAQGTRWSLRPKGEVLS